MVNRSQRIHALDRLLRQGRRLVATTVAAEWGVDEKTIRRDLTEVLRDQYRLPVKFDRIERCWFYDGPAAELPGTLVSSGDRLAMLLSLQAAEQFRGTPVYDNLKALHDRLLTTLPPETRTTYAALASKIRFEGPPTAPMPAGVWNTVLNARDGQTTLSFEYHTGHSGQVCRREIDPYGRLVVRHREWYLIGHDHFRDAVRTFYLPRMRDVEDTDRTFYVRDDFKLDEYLATAVDGQQSTGPVYRVVLRFDKAAAHLGEEYVWNETQRVSRDEEGRVVEFETGALYEVERQVLGWGGRVVVLDPQHLRASVAKKARMIYDAHTP